MIKSKQKKVKEEQTILFTFLLGAHTIREAVGFLEFLFCLCVWLTDDVEQGFNVGFWFGI